MQLLSARNQGFTLLELLIVVVIIGIIAALVLVRFGDVKSGAYKAAMLNDLRNFTTSTELYFDEHGSYPASPAAAPGFAYSDDVSVKEYSLFGPTWSLVLQHGKTDATCVASGGTRAGGNPPPACGDDFLFTFDGAVCPAVATQALPGDYEGFTWTNFSLANVDFFPGMQAPTYPCASFNGDGDPASLASDTPFVLRSAQFAGGWNDITFHVTGYSNGGAEVEWEKTFNATYRTNHLVTFPNIPVTSIEFVTTTDVDGGLTHGSIDNMAIDLREDAG